MQHAHSRGCFTFVVEKLEKKEKLLDLKLFHIKNILISFMFSFKMALIKS